MTIPDGAMLAARLRDGDRSAAPQTLNLVENRTPEGRRQTAALLRELSPARLGGEAQGHIVGVTGPPGAGKSTLLGELLRTWRGRGLTVAVLAVDPSSRRTGGSLLGDRARIAFDPTDDGVLIRSTAAAGRLGGLAPSTREAAGALVVAFDIVVVETVGVGQSETDIAELADTVAVVIQPGSGDALQFIKSGIMEIPDVLVVTKADLREVALRARRDLAAALRSVGERDTAVISVSSLAPATGIDELADALAAHRTVIDVPARRAASRRGTALAAFGAEYGERGLRAVGGRRAAERRLAEADPQADIPALLDLLSPDAGQETT
ncbi:unannotated protein [freshwater metagenome]|uniref:Unannotated protein n=1 Tax=freshwater metagenome TaxID=449393 RepID=A0A6J7CZQ9_9ZZZZ|nr:ArgK protein [Actinomycetota bacterium]